VAQNVIEILLKARDEATAQLKAAATATSGLNSALAGLSSIAGPVAAVTGALVAVGSAAINAAKSLAEEVEQLQNLSSQSGVSIQNLQTLQQLLKEAGGSAGDATQAINFLNRAIATNDPLLKKLGITTRDTWTAFNQLVQVLASSDDAAARTEVAFQLLGRGSTVLLGKIDSIAAQLPNARSEMEKLGVVMGADTVEAAKALDVQMDQLDRRWKGMVNTIKGAILPAVLSLFEAFNTPPSGDQVLEKSVKRITLELDNAQKKLREARLDGNQTGIDFFIKKIDTLKERLAQLQLQVGIASGARVEGLTDEDSLDANRFAADVAKAADANVNLQDALDDTGAKGKAAQKALDELAKALKDVRDSAATPELAKLAEGFVKADASAGRLLQTTKEYLALAIRADIEDTARALAAQDNAAAKAAQSMGDLARSAADIPQIELTLGEVPAITVPPVPPVVLSVAAPNVPAITVPPVPPISLSIAPVDVPAIEVPPVPPIALTFGPVPAVNVPPIVAPPIELSVGEVPAVELPTLVPPPIVFTVAPVDVPEIAAPVVPPIALTVAPIPPIVVPPVASPVITPTVTPIPPIEVPAPVVPDIVLKVAPIPPVDFPAVEVPPIALSVAPIPPVEFPPVEVPPVVLSVAPIPPVDFPAVNVPPVVVSVAPIPAPVVPPVETPEIVYKVQPIPAPEFPAIEVPQITVPPIKLSVDAAGIGDLASQAAAAASQVDALAAAVDRVQPVSLTIPPIDLSSGVADLAKLSQGLTDSAAAAEELRRQTAAPVVVSADASGLEAAGKAAQALRAEAGRRIAVSVDGAPLASLREQYEAVGAVLKAAALGVAGFGGLFLETTSATDAHAASVAKLTDDYKKFLGVAAPLRELLKTVGKAGGDAVDEFGKPLQPKTTRRDKLEQPQELDFDFEGAAAQQRALILSATKLGDAMKQAAADWKAVVDEMTTTTAIAHEAFGALFDGLQNGFQAAFSGLLTQGQSFKSAMKTIFQSLVNEIIAMLARLAALKVFQLVVGAASGGAGAGIGGFPLPIPGTGGFGLTASAPGGAASAIAREQQSAAMAKQTALLEQQNALLEASLSAPRGGDSYSISSINAKTVLESLTAPGGEFRTARDRLDEIAAVA